MKSKNLRNHVKQTRSMMPVGGIGIDIEDVVRFRSRNPTTNKNFYRKIFTEKEMRYCMAKPDPYPHFTARFCAKEAITKVLGRTLFRANKIEVVNDVTGRPEVCLLDDKKPTYIIMLSLSHTKHQAIAIALVLSI